MSDGTRNHGYRNGFTLVELLVVLVIMAGLVAMASVSVETTQSKARADKTAAIGNGVVEALERSDGLSFVSDFGRLPKHADELMFLFSQRTAAPYRLSEVSLPDDGTPSIPSEVKTLFGSPSLGVGWRGPYSTITTLHQDESGLPKLLDGWKKEWKVLDEDEAPLNGGKLAKLQSWGRDHLEDLETPPDWQDRDLDFDLHANFVTKDINLQINPIIRSRDGNPRVIGTADISTLEVFYFAPNFDSYFPAETTGKNENIATVRFTSNGSSWVTSSLPEGREEKIEQGNSIPFLENLTVGHRLIFLYASGTASAGGGSGIFVGAPRLVRIQPGTNNIDYILDEIE